MRHRFTGEVLFTWLVTAFVLVMLYQSASLSRVSRLVPLAVIVPTLCLLVLQLFLDYAPDIGKNYKGFGRLNLFGAERVRAQASRADADTNNANALDERPRPKREAHLLLWLASLLLAVYLGGLLLALPAYTLLYLRKRARESWRLSFLAACVIYAVLHGVFILALRVRLYEGFVWRWMNF